MSGARHESVAPDFRNLQRLTNHWARPMGSPRYYWYLTFEDSPELRHAVRQCQKALSFPYYDLTPLSDLHLTLDRVAFAENITSPQLSAIEAAAMKACSELRSFAITVDCLGGTSGAVGFNASPVEPISQLRDALRQATLSVLPDAPVRDSKLHPHVAIAYCNSDDVPATQAVATVEKLNSLPSVQVLVKEVALVLLKRRPRAYAWQIVSSVPLSG